MVCLHGFLDTWRIWELALPALERRHDVLALTLAGHAGGPPLEGPLSGESLPDAVERAMDAAGFETAHLVGNSLGGYVALQLAARGRARTVVALAPAGGWAPDDDSYRELLRFQRGLLGWHPSGSFRCLRFPTGPRHRFRETTWRRCLASFCVSPRVVALIPRLPDASLRVRMRAEQC